MKFFFKDTEQKTAFLRFNDQIVLLRSLEVNRGSGISENRIITENFLNYSFFRIKSGIILILSVLVNRMSVCSLFVLEVGTQNV